MKKNKKIIICDNHYGIFYKIPDELLKDILSSGKDYRIIFKGREVHPGDYREFFKEKSLDTPEIF